MRAHKAKTISAGPPQIVGGCADSLRRGVSEPRCEGEPPEIDALSVSALINFFDVLDRWDREVNGNAKAV
jgi:hypothetical protein